MELSSARRKLARAVQHIETLRDETSALVDDEGYQFRVDTERRSPHEVVYRSVAVQRLPIPDHWPLLAGEAVQNLRSALDHAVWSAWKSVPENTGTGHHTQFPIFTNPDDFRGRAPRMLDGVPDPIRTRIEAAQPYNTMPTAPARERLELLRSLSNIDKHRTLAAVVTAVRFEFVGIRPDINTRWEKFAAERPLDEGETEISVLVATASAQFEETEVSPGFDYEVRIEGRPTGTLASIAQRVFEAVTEVETGEPISPYLEYPIYPG